MAVLTKKQNNILWAIRFYSDRLTRQQVRTLRGQVLAGDVDGAEKGLTKILNWGGVGARKSKT